MTDIDLDTVRRAQRGDEAAARTILEVLHRPVIATIYRFLGSRWQSEIEDIAQEVFLKVFRAIERFDPGRGVKFTTWVYTFVRNHCFDVLRRKRLAMTSLTETEDEGQVDVQGHETGPPRAAESRELGTKIEAAMQELGEDQRLAFVLREYEGLDYAAIAEVMGCSEGTVKSRLHRAKESLRHRLAPYLKAGA